MKGFTFKGRGALKEKYMSSQNSLINEVPEFCLSCARSFSCKIFPSPCSNSSTREMVLLGGRAEKGSGKGRGRRKDGKGSENENKREGV